MDENPLIKKGFAVGIILFFIGASCFPSIAQDTKTSSQTTRGNWLYVGGSGPGNYSRIQDAIDNASDGNTIFVYNGTYHERPTMMKPLRLMGEGKQTTIIDGDHLGTGITIGSNNTRISGFTLRNCDDNTIWERWEILAYRYIDGHLLPLSNITIDDCIVTQGKEGIIFYCAINSRVQNCVIINNSGMSLVLRNSSENTIIDNSTFSFNGQYIDNNSFYPGSIDIDSNMELCKNLTITHCTITNNIGDGLDLVGACNASVKYSDIQNNSVSGIVVERDENVTIERNKIADNEWAGIYAEDGLTSEHLLHNVMIKNNTILRNGERDGYQKAGIFIRGCKGSISIIQNNISSNYGHGIYLQSSNNNVISRNNFEDNPCHASNSKTWKNTWVNNYWDNWIGIGPKIIIGQIQFLPWINFDWHPAQEPYNNIGDL